MIVVPMFNFVLLLLNSFLGVLIGSRPAATASKLALGEAGIEKRIGVAAATLPAETWTRSEPVPGFGQLGEIQQRG
jgi:hypothetical protein